jgi:hypothetical protein
MRDFLNKNEKLNRTVMENIYMANHKNLKL